MSRLLTLTVFWLAVSMHAMALDIEEGMWELQLQPQVPGMASHMMPAQRIQQCMSRSMPVPEGQYNVKGCDVDTDVSGNRVTWTISCSKDNMNLSGRGSATYTGTTMDGESVMDVEGMPMTIRTRITGRRIGDC